MTIDKHSWGHRDDVAYDDYMTTKELITEIVTTVSCGGNILINVGPSKSGTIEAIFTERLLDMGKWLAVNGEAIYGSKPWIYQNDTVTSGVWYTMKMNSGQQTVYAMVLERPIDGNSVAFYAVGKFVKSDSSVELLGYDGDIQASVMSVRRKSNDFSLFPLQWEKRGSSLLVELPDEPLIRNLQWAWTVKVTI
jgi:alpha-L-fucosidase